LVLPDERMAHLTWFVLAAAVPDGTQMLAVDAPVRRDAMIFAEKQIREVYKLPTSYEVMGQVLEECSTEEEARLFMVRLRDALDKVKEKDAQEADQVQGL
jgi:hypothetical protein